MENTPETKTATIEVNQEPVKKFIFKKIDPKILYVILIAFLFLTGGAIYMVRQNAKLDLTKSINGSSASLVNKTTNKSQTTLNNDNQQQIIISSETKKLEKTFNFVNTNPWVELSSKDKAYTIKIGPNYTYGYCQGDQETTMVGMIYMNQSGVYDCNSVTTALSTSNASLPLTRIAFGIATDSSTRGNVKPLRVTILNGVNAERYEYMDTVNDKSYRHIEYIVLHKGKEYTAHMQWEDGYDLSSGSNISLDTFDTIAQKTWKFN